MVLGAYCRSCRLAHDIHWNHADERHVAYWERRQHIRYAYHCHLCLWSDGMPSQSVARVSTESGQRLINRLCKHWAHKLEVDAEQGKVVFDGGVCLMKA